MTSLLLLLYSLIAVTNEQVSHIMDLLTYNNHTDPMNVNNTSDSLLEDVHQRYNLQEFFVVFRPLALYVDRGVTPVWYLVGITGNLLAATVWLDRRIRLNNSSAIYLATLSIADLIFLLLHILQELKYAWGWNTLDHLGMCESYFTLSLVAQYLSPILVLAFTVERWIAVCHPFVKEKYCTSHKAVRVVICLVGVCLLLGLMQSYFWTYNSQRGQCDIRLEAILGGSASLWSIWTWITEMLVFLVVPLVILVFNVLVIKEIQTLSKASQRMLPTSTGSGHTGNGHSNNSGSAASTVMLLSVSFYVILTTLPATLVYALYQRFPEGNTHLPDQDIRENPQWNSYFTYMTYRKFVEEICLSHYACNFFLYVITGPQFRKSLMTLCLFSWFKRKTRASTKYVSEATKRTSLKTNYAAVNENGMVSTNTNM